MIATCCLSLWMKKSKKSVLTTMVEHRGHSDHFSLASIVSNNPFWQRQHKWSGISRVKDIHGQGDILNGHVFCASVHMTLSSENKCCCNVGTILLVLCPSIFAVAACEKPNVLEVGTSFLKISPYSPETFLHPKQQEEQPPENSSWVFPDHREESS